MTKRTRTTAVAVVGAAFAMIAALVAGMVPAQAADHLDAPGLTSPDGIGQLDINDVYAFEGKPGKTTLAMTVSPLAGADTKFADGFNNTYTFRIDLDGDAVADRAIHVRTIFSLFGEQVVVVQQARGRAANADLPQGSVRGIGLTNYAFGARGGTEVFAGLRSDPFFFDLSGFQGTVEGNGEDALGQDPTDFFADANTLAIVVEIPDSQLNDGGPINVWGTTSRNPSRSFFGSWEQVDRMGRPAINTVVNSSGPIVGAPSEAKNLFNDGVPANDVENFTPAVVDALKAYSSLDSEGPYADAQAEALAGVLLPDVLAYDKGGALPPPLNGRALADDVIDTELRIVTGGDPLGLFDDRDADGGVNSDGVGPHDDYLAKFPYLGQPNS